MANNNEFVDITSASELNRVYKKKNTNNRVTRSIVLLCSIFALIFGSLLILLYNSVDLINYRNEERINYATADQAGGGTTVSTDSLLEDANVLNILLFGQDAVGEGEGDYGRSDTIILMSIDNNNQKLKLTSFQRDTYVAIPGYGDGKLNSAFSLGGVPLSIAMVEANFGVHVDKYACVDFDSFRKIIEVLGGVDMELTIEEIEYINAQIDVNNQLSKTSFIEYDSSLETQVIHLDGYQALWYARDRGAENLGGVPGYTFSGDDWDRTERQRKLIETIMTSLKETASLSDMVEIVNQVGPLVTTNLKKNDITFLVSNSMTYLSYDMVEKSMPTTGNWRYGMTDDGQSVISVTNWEQVRYDLAKFIYESKVSTD